MATDRDSEVTDFPTSHDLITFQFDDIPRLLRKRIDAVLSSHSLGRTQWRLLAYALREEGQTQTALASQLELERAPLGQAIDKLVERGLLERSRKDGDRRAWQILPTDEARALLPELRAGVDTIYSQMFKGFTKQEIGGLSVQLSRLAQNLSA